MAMVINSNIPSLNAQRNLNTSQSSLSTSLQRLSSGLRINSAKDDAAGMAISSRMTSQIDGINQAVRNANDGISLSQTAEGGISTAGDLLQRMRVLAVQSANATNSTTDREALQAEVTQLASELDRVATQTQFNGLNLLDGSFTAQRFQVGANAGQTITIDQIASARSADLGAYQGFQLNAQAIGVANNTAAAASLTINGGTAISLGSIATDAKAIAAAINVAGISGMSATANATLVAAGTSADSSTASGAATVTINGTAISVAGVTGGGAALVGNRASAITAINAQSAVTGVRATDTGAGVSLSAADGRNITVAFAAGGFTAATEASFGLAAPATTGGTINVSYSAPTGTTGAVAFLGAAVGLGSNTIATTGAAIDAIDISTANGASTALASIDAALASINSSRAALGAYQNRFSAAVTNLQATSENLSSSRSRILDADFAQETANLSRAQILQQAGTAMLAQANSLPQNVLSLLK